MEPVVPVLTAAAAAMADTAVKEGTKKIVGSLWQALVTAAKRRFGNAHAAPVLIERLGDVGKDPAKLKSVALQLEPLQIGADAEVLAIIRKLAEALKQAAPGTSAAEQSMHDSAGAVQAQGDATVQQASGNSVNVESVTGAVFSFGSQHFHRSN